MAMLINLLGDFRKESGLEEVLNGLLRKGFRDFFMARDYGTSLRAIAVIPVCQDPALALKPRRRLSKKDRTLYVDLLFDLDLMKSSSPGEREQVFIQEFMKVIPSLIESYKPEDFDLAKFRSDLENWFEVFAKNG